MGSLQLVLYRSVVSTRASDKSKKFGTLNSYKEYVALVYTVFVFFVFIQYAFGSSNHLFHTY